MTRPSVLVAVVAGVLLIGGAALAALLWPRFPGDDSAEAGFARDMSVHHAQAVEMAELIRPRTEDPELRQLATDIVLTQQAQIGRISGWLDVWGLRATGTQPPMAWMGMGGQPVIGMASQADVNALATLSVAEAEERFLRLMIRHHRGGVLMAEAILERTDREEVVRLAESIVVGQTAEIEAMQAMLEARGLERETETEMPMPSSRGVNLRSAAGRETRGAG